MVAFLGRVGVLDPVALGLDTEPFVQSPGELAITFFGGVGLFMLGLFLTVLGVGALAALRRTRRR